MCNRQSRCDVGSKFGNRVSYCTMLCRLERSDADYLISAQKSLVVDLLISHIFNLLSWFYSLFNYDFWCEY